MSTVDNLVIGMRCQQIKNSRANARFTLLTRGEGSDGTWQPNEVTAIINGLVTEAYQLESFPQHVILWGGFTKEQVLKAMGGGATFTAEEVVGYENDKLPFRPFG